MTSPLDWASNLPMPWDAKPLRAVAAYTVSNVDKVPADGEVPVRLCNYSDVYNNEFIALELDFMRATATEVEIEKFGLQIGDVVITKDSESWDDIGVPALVKETASDLVCGYHLAILRPRKSLLDGSFLFRCLQAKPVRLQLELAANGVTRFGISKADIGTMTVPVPPLPHQRVIADYLDRETARLDALVAAKEQALGLLAEKRRALITRAVTRGLDPHVPLRDSGLSWLAEIPAHWHVVHLKRVLANMDYGLSESVDVSGSIAVLRMGDLRNGEIDYTNIGFIDDVDEALLLHRDDLIFNRTNSLDQIGKVAIFRGNLEYPVTFASYLVRLRCNAKATAEFLNLLLNSSHVVAWARSEALPAIGQVNLNPNRYAYLPVALPPVGEQQTIATHVTTETAKLDALRAATERTIVLLKERRAALIAAAVTGQIGVQGNPARV